MLVYELWYIYYAMLLQVSSINVLGVHISNDLYNGVNTESVPHKASLSHYALKVVKATWIVTRFAYTSLCSHYGLISNLCSTHVAWVYYY